jgi:hypothetical protein
LIEEPLSSEFHFCLICIAAGQFSSSLHLASLPCRNKTDMAVPITSFTVLNCFT